MMRRLIEREGDDLLSPKDEGMKDAMRKLPQCRELDEGKDEAAGGAVAWFEACWR